MKNFVTFSKKVLIPNKNFLP